MLEFIFCWKTRISFASNWHSTNEHLIFQMSSFRLKLPRHIFDKKRVPSLYALGLCYSTYSIIYLLPIDSSLKVWGLNRAFFCVGGGIVDYIQYNFQRRRPWPLSRPEVVVLARSLTYTYVLLLTVHHVLLRDPTRLEQHHLVGPTNNVDILSSLSL